MAETPQTYATHRRFLPIYHFIAVPIFAINLIIQIYFAVKRPGIWSLWNAIVALGFVLLAIAARFMVLRVQDRVIRLEERLRLQQILPADLKGRIGELGTRQLIAIRFCDDAEAPELCRAVLNGEVTKSNDIKRRIKTWRPDNARA